MNRNFTLIVLLYLTVSSVFAQDGAVISGKIIVKDATPGNVHVINVTNEKETITNAGGEFTILVQVDDVLVFSGEHLDFMRKIVERQDIDAGNIIIEMTSKTIVLDEVEITAFTAVGLGILSKPAKQYTPAERRLYTATSTPLDGLLNAISGRKKMLENEVKLEQKAFVLDALEGLYPDTFYSELGIQKNDIKGFHYFIVEQPGFAAAIQANDTKVASFLIIELALKFNASKQTNED